MRRKTNEESRVIDRFKSRYDRTGTRAERAVERAAIGGNVGCNGYTTIAQAAALGRALRLRRGKLLLDIGCGRGYPGMYLAETTGCSAIGTDLPLASLRTARARTLRRRVSGRTAVLAASAVHLPFRNQRFDAVVHTDVLC
jgi:SAM-dependent methyltransferase